MKNLWDVEDRNEKTVSLPPHDYDDDDMAQVVVVVIKPETIYTQIFFGKGHNVWFKESKYNIKNIHFINKAKSLLRTVCPQYRGPWFNLRHKDRPY
jgi:hypothetical protein